MRGSDWQSFRRSLAILRRLRQSPASPAQLIEAVLQTEGPDAYPQAKSAREKAFKRDRENLRTRLGVDFTYDARVGQYILGDAGELFSLTLSEASLSALGLLQNTFEGQVAINSSIETLLEELSANLNPADRRRMEWRENTLEVALLQNIEDGGIPKRVWDETHRAVRKHRRFSFNYISPQYTDEQPVLQEVNPIKIVFQWGHWYLLAYRLARAGQTREHGRSVVRHVRYRISNIQDDPALQVSPTILPPAPAAPQFEVRYRLLPPLSRASISVHFANQSHRRLDDGTVEVSGLTESVWEAGKLFLSYGESCMVLGGSEMMEHMTKELRGLVRNYPDLDL